MPLHMVQISKVKYFGFCYLLLDLWVDLRSICLLMVALIFICWPTFHILKSNPPIYNKKHLILGDTTSDTLKVILCHIFSSQANFKIEIHGKFHGYRTCQHTQHIHAQQLKRKQEKRKETLIM